MVNILKFKHKLCRKYGEDIWGTVLQKGKFNKTGEYLSNVDTRMKRLSRTSAFKTILNDRKKVCLFYGGLKAYELLRYCKTAKYNGTGAFTDDVVSLLERRLAVVVYRMQFSRSIAEAITYIKRGYFLVNREVLFTGNYLVNVGDIIEVNPKYRKELWRELNDRLGKEFFPVTYPKYLEVNYQIMSGVLVSEPKMSEVYYPFNLEHNFYYIYYHSRIR